MPAPSSFCLSIEFLSRICRFVAVDHHTGDVYVLAMHETMQPDSLAAASAWIESTAERINAVSAPSSVEESAQAKLLPPAAHSASRRAGTPQKLRPDDLGFRSRHEHAKYLSNVEACKQVLFDRCQPGIPLLTKWFSTCAVPEPNASPLFFISAIPVLQALYDGCLTTMLERGDAPSGLQLYDALRRINPAPYSAWLSFGGSDASDRIQVCCSSPERFLRGGRGGTLEAKPIKVR